jgi:hypothetical protein
VPILLSIGTPTPQKLANFLGIDVFVLLSCPQTSLLASKDFHKPIVTLGEVELGLQEQGGWDLREYRFGGGPGLTAAAAPPSVQVEGTPSAVDDASPPHGASGALALREAWTVGTHPTSMLSRSHTHYTGLDPTLMVPVASEVPEGRMGLARGYTHEPGQA